MRLADCVSHANYRRLARRRLPRVLFDYLDGGSWNEVTLRANVDALAAARLDQRVGRDMGAVDLSTTLFGQKLGMPVALAPIGFAGMYARRGEVQAARAARDAGVPFTLSTVGICPADELAQAGLPFWYQLYIVRDRGFVDAMVDRVAALGCGTLVVTMDLTTPGARYRDQRSGMAARLGWAGQVRRWADGAAHPRWLYDVHLRGRPHSFGNLAGVTGPAAGFPESWAWISANFDPGVTWADIATLRRRWHGTLIVKGVLHPDDARAAFDSGADGIVVSNHGGRQLDGAPASLSVLPHVREAVGDEAIVLMDGGIRSGLDVLKAVRAGADACLIGRAWVAALAAGGQPGVTRMLRQMREELHAGVVLSGGLRV